ncbi:hypothetical protein Tco_1173287 [Tanacetum coccineum]
MKTLKFADTHNMVTFLSKPEESDGFEQIVDFMNAHPIKYALSVNPTIYTLCIEHFWSTVKAKTINGEVQLHALVYGKKIIITQSTVRRDLQLEDAEGVNCLPNATIFEELTRMGLKTTAWNEFSSTMESAIICLTTNQKFNFSKYIFESMVRNLDNLSRKILMYPRKPKRKDTQVPQPSGPTEIVTDEAVHKELGDSLVRAAITAFSLEAEQDSGNITKTRSNATPNESSSLGTILGGGPRVKKLEKKRSSRTHKLKRLYKVGLTARVESSGDEEDLDDADKEMFDVNVLNAERTWVKRNNIEEPMKPIKKKVQIMLNEEADLKLQDEFDKEERLVREKAEKEKEANIALIEEWDDIQANIDVDYQLAKRLQAQEQEELSDAKKATLFQQLLEKIRTHFVAKRAKERRNKPPTKA